MSDSMCHDVMGIKGKPIQGKIIGLTMGVIFLCIPLSLSGCVTLSPKYFPFGQHTLDIVHSNREDSLE